MIIESLRTDESIDKVCNLYFDMIYRIALSMVKSQYNADDIFQEVFLRYFKKNRVFEDEEHRKAWLIRVTINMCKNYYLSNWLRKTAQLTDNFAYKQKEEIFLQDEINKLPIKYKVVIHLFYFEDMSIKEISHILKIRSETIKMQLNRARGILKKRIGGDLFD